MRIPLRFLFCYIGLIVSTVVVYLYNDHASTRTLSMSVGKVGLLGGEREYNGVGTNGTCGYSSMAKSWSTFVVTQYSPHLSPRCESLWAGEEQEVSRIKNLIGSLGNSVSDDQFLEQLRNCTYVEDVLSDNFYTSPEETSFPVAFFLTIHDFPQQVLRLLRVIYRPHNVYCIHVDAKAKQELIEAFRSLSSCVPNILMPKKLVNVIRYYGERFLEAQLSCLEVLHSAHDTWKWRYVMNLCGTELPLATNRHLIERLEWLKGSTYIFDSVFPDSMRNTRFGQKYMMQNCNTNEPCKSNERFGKPPYGMQLYKSSTYIIMSYAFADFILTHPKAIALRKYMKGGRTVEEHFYATLYHVPEAPIGDPPSKAWKRHVTSIWVRSDASHAICNAAVRHNLCLAGVGTMKYIDEKIKHTSLFMFNKYSAEKDHVIMDCMEKRLIAKNKLEYVQDCT